MENRLFSMDDCFLIKNVRKDLLDKLKEKGYSDEKINKFITICDEMYNECKIPYPTML